MANSIVTINVSQTNPPAPPTLQRTGAMVSQGATTTAPGTLTLLTQKTDLNAILTGAAAISTLAWSANVVTATTVAPHGIDIGDVIILTISGATPSAYNGTYPCTITGASTFTYPLVGNPGVETVPGVYTPEDVAELVAMVGTFFAQGAQQSVYVLELGPESVVEGIASLNTYIGNNPGQEYLFLVPRAWAADGTYLAFVNGFVALNAKVYFYTTLTTGNYATYANVKSVVGLIEAPGIPATEFSLAAVFWVELNYNPSSTNKVTPFAFSFLFGVTAYPTSGNGALLTALKAAGVNVVGTGAEGGLSNKVLFWGTTMDVKDVTYWYSVDWVQLNEDQAISNAIINGSNNPANPLYYNQDGINRLQAVAAGVISSGVSFGLIFGTVQQTQLTAAQFAAALQAGTFAGQAVINAVPFTSYTTQNPNDYPAGVYNGLSITFVPARGFTAITINLNVSNFVAQ